MHSLQKILKTPEIKHLFTVLQGRGIEARLVGGCVRDFLLGIKTKDIDIAVNAPPEQTLFILRQAGIKVIPTGIDHGTITAVLNKISFQITSLRQDWQTFGRHAKVIFGTDWLEDAKRRDFTMNALYLNEKGDLYDPFQGKKDLEKGIIRFIGDPDQRIKEDYLRILRYYRFLAYYGKSTPESIKELSELKEGLLNLSKERIQTELFKLLEAKDPRVSLSLMKKDGIFRVLFCSDLNISQLFNLIELELSLDIKPDYLRRLYAFLGANKEIYKSRFCLSRQQRHYLDELEEALKQDDRRYVYYYFGSKIFLDWVLLRKALLLSSNSARDEIKWMQKVVADFPLTGQDLLKKGFSEGPVIGKVLKKCEIWWIEHDFQPGKEACLQYCLMQLTRNT